MEPSQTAQASHQKEETKMEKQSVRGAMCKLAEEVIAGRAENNDASLIAAIIKDPHSDFVCIPVSYLASLPEIVNFVPKLEAVQREKFLVNVLMEFSDHLKVNKDKEGKVTIRTEYKRDPRNTLIMHSVPAGAKEDDLLELFRGIPTAASVSFKEIGNSCWEATFDTEDNAISTHSALSKQKLMVKGKPISVGLRATRFVRVNPAATVPTPQQTPPANMNMRQGMPPAMRQQYFAMQQQYFAMQLPQLYFPQYYGPMQQPRGPHQPNWPQQQQKQRSARGGHQRYSNAGHQQQRANAAAQEQMAAATAAAATAGASATQSAASPAPAPAAAPQQQQQQRDGQRQGQGRGGRNYRNRNRNNGGNRGHGSQSTASESSSTEGGAAPKEHRQRQSAAASERQEQSKPQEKPTADSFPPLM